MCGRTCITSAPASRLIGLESSPGNRKKSAHGRYRISPPQVIREGEAYGDKKPRRRLKKKIIRGETTYSGNSVLEEDGRLERKGLTETFSFRRGRRKNSTSTLGGAGAKDGGRKWT